MKKNLCMAAVLTAGMVLLSGCAKKTNETEKQLNENEPAKMEVKAVEGRQNFTDKMVITPLPAIMIATYDAEGIPDVMMAAWGGQAGSNRICFYLSEHKTTANLRLKKACTVSFADKKTIAQSDYFGIVSANDVPDKVAKAGFTATKSPNVDAPIINEYPLALECKVLSMDEEDGRVVCEVVNMSADESILDAEGNVDLEKLQPVVFDSSKNLYRVVGEKVGEAWGSGKSIQEAEVK